MCYINCKLSEQKKILLNKIPLFIDFNIFQNVFEEQKTTFIFTEKTKKSFVNLLKTGKRYIIIIPGNSFDRQFFKTDKGIYITSLLKTWVFEIFFGKLNNSKFWIQIYIWIFLFQEN